jgi:two-component system cell cycle response regulator
MDARAFQILIVSPNRGNLRRLSKFLEVFGYNVQQATSSAGAVAAAEAASPDFLIVDCSDGQTANLPLCREIRRIWPQRYTYCLLAAQGMEMGDVTAALEAGFDDFLAGPIVFGELLARLRVGARFIEFERRIGEHAGIDALTGLADKSALKHELNRRSAGAKGTIGWLALYDVDDFSRVGRRHGHFAAQDLLGQIGRHIRATAGEGGFVSGNGDDRFAVLMPNSGSESAIARCEEFLVELADTTFTISQQTNRLTASCGLTEVKSGETLEVVEARAMQALRLAKKSGQNCVVTSDDVDRDAQEWAELAAEGKLFETTLARDVMQHCPVFLQLDETLEHAHAVLSQTGLAHVPVVDADKRLAGVVSLDQVAAARLRNPKQRSDAGGGNSVRLVRHILTKDVARFDVDAPLAELMEFFTGENSNLAIIVADKEPKGIVYCHSLASLNERLTADHFAATQTSTGTSADLLVPDLVAAE